eukprot:354452-Chlamydomonas_euryale.AAC.2
MATCWGGHADGAACRMATCRVHADVAPYKGGGACMRGQRAAGAACTRASCGSARPTCGGPPPKSQHFLLAASMDHPVGAEAVLAAQALGAPGRPVGEEQRQGKVDGGQRRAA